MLAAPGVFTRYHIPHSQAVSLIPQLFDNENNKVDETQTWLTVVRCSQGKCFICPNLTVVLSGTKSGLSKSYATELTRILFTFSLLASYLNRRMFSLIWSYVRSI